jgi:uncharacterized peroxidase-related enzyme
MSVILYKFTKSVPHWRPRVRPVDLATATDEQRDALQVTPSNTKVSEYLLVLAHDPQSLKVRSPLFNAIMYDEGGLSRAERELGAIGASMVNRCVYCAAVHASRHAQIEKDDTVTDQIFSKGEDAELSARDRAIFDFAIALSKSPSAAGAKELTALQDAGLDPSEILDLVLSSALFGWANRLMHILGDPVRQAT